MIKRFKRWLVEKYLPAYAKEELLAINTKLCERVQALEQQVEQQQAYISGMRTAMKWQRKITINGGVAHERVVGTSSDRQN